MRIPCTISINTDATDPTARDATVRIIDKVIAILREKMITSEIVDREDEYAVISGSIEVANPVYLVRRRAMATTNEKLLELVEANPEAAANFIIQLLAQVVDEEKGFIEVDTCIAYLPQKDRNWAYDVFEQTCLIASGK